MKVYKMVHLNKGVRMSREKDLEVSENVLNQYIAEGWTLQQIVATADGTGTLIAVMYKGE